MKSEKRKVKGKAEGDRKSRSQKQKAKSRRRRLFYYIKNKLNINKYITSSIKKNDAKNTYACYFFITVLSE